MKTRKLRKFLMLLASALLLVSVTVGATVAFLTDTSEVVTNTFTVGKVEITLDETKVTEYGEVDETATQPVTANQYKLIPGHEYIKDPTVHVKAGSENGYLFVKVENGIAAIEAKPEEGEIDTTIAAQMEALGWTLVNGTSNVYYYEETKNAGDVKVFEKFVLADDANVAAYLNASITIEAYMVQADGFEDALDAYVSAGAPTGWAKGVLPEEAE